MEEQEFINDVLSKISIADPNDQRDNFHVNSCIRNLFQEGFSVAKAVRFCNCLEEVNPTLDENIALQRMAEIKKEVEFETKNKNIEAQYKKVIEVQYNCPTCKIDFCVYHSDEQRNTECHYCNGAVHQTGRTRRLYIKKQNPTLKDVEIVTFQNGIEVSRETLKR